MEATELTTIVSQCAANDPSLTSVYICYCAALRSEGAMQSLVEALQKNTCVTSLSVVHCGLDDALATQLAEVVRSTQTLVEVDLSRNKIGNEGASALAKALAENESVRTLDLGTNKIGDVGATAIAHALAKNETLWRLHLQRNAVQSFGAEALARALKKNASLVALNLRNNELLDDGASELAKGLRVNKGVTYVDVGSNKILDYGLKMMAIALRDNPNLTRVVWDDNTADDTRILKALLKFERRNQEKCRAKFVQAARLLGVSQVDQYIVVDRELGSQSWRDKAVYTGKDLAFVRDLGEVEVLTSNPLYTEDVAKLILSYVDYRFRFKSN
eukprot:TRINITY_DN58534_c0_g1_i1.p1 TRINITY_DN58534_c0_g1~~TRINITY_DN58534_c0_g1_i1.p1  ORF type:complete len:330 (-),score=148.08 TRINITY_DN58534_c0_g1_i1:80-1069(-)